MYLFFAPGLHCSMRAFSSLQCAGFLLQGPSSCRAQTLGTQGFVAAALDSRALERVGSSKCGAGI